MAKLKNQKGKIEQRHERISEQIEQFIKELIEYMKRDIFLKPIYPRFEKFINELRQGILIESKSKKIINLSLFYPLESFITLTKLEKKF